MSLSLPSINTSPNTGDPTPTPIPLPIRRHIHLFLKRMRQNLTNTTYYIEPKVHLGSKRCNTIRRCALIQLRIHCSCRRHRASLSFLHAYGFFVGVYFFFFKAMCFLKSPKTFLPFAFCQRRTRSSARRVSVGI